MKYLIFFQRLTKSKPDSSRHRRTWIWPSLAWSITKQFALHQEKRGFCAQFASGIQPCCVPGKTATKQIKTGYPNPLELRPVATCLHSFIYYKYTASYYVQNIASLHRRMILEEVLQIMCGSNLVNIRC